MSTAVADSPNRRSVLLATLAVVSIAVVVALGLVVVWQCGEVSNKNRQIETLTREARSKDEEIARLRDEVKRLNEQVELLQRELHGKTVGASNRNGAAKEPTAMAIHDWLLFYPSKYPEGNWTPANLEYEDCWFESADGVKLHGWHCPHEKPRAALLISQGNAGNLSYWDDLLRFAHDKLGVSSFIYDYRGYGRSAGKPTVPGVLLDARAARTEFAKREGIDPRSIVLFGRSLGGAVSIDLAAEEGARGLIVESTFTSLRDVAGGHYPPALVNLLVPDALNSASRIARHRGPLLLSHGTDDSIVPLVQGERLFAAANDPKQFVSIPGGDHNDPQTSEYYRAFEKFIGSLPK